MGTIFKGASVEKGQNNLGTAFFLFFLFFFLAINLREILRGIFKANVNLP